MWKNSDLKDVLYVLSFLCVWLFWFVSLFVDFVIVVVRVGFFLFFGVFVWAFYLILFCFC